MPIVRITILTSPKIMISFRTNLSHVEYSTLANAKPPMIAPQVGVNRLTRPLPATIIIIIVSTLKSWDLKGNALIDAFDEEQEAILHSDQEWRVKSVKKDRIEYFKKCGIDHGDNYEEYMDDPECQRKIPSLDFIKMVREKRLELYTRMGNEFYLSTEDYKKNRKRIEESGCLVDKVYF